MEDDFPLPDEPSPRQDGRTPEVESEDDEQEPMPQELALALRSMAPITTDPLTEYSALQDVMRDDIQFYNKIMQHLALAWQFANPINYEAICKLSETTSKMLMARRKALLLPTEKARGKMFAIEGEEIDE